MAAGLVLVQERHQENHSRDRPGQNQHEEEDLPEGVRTLALDVAVLAVHLQTERLSGIEIGSEIERQEHVLEADVAVMRPDIVDPLLVSADIGAHVSLDRPRHDSLRPLPGGLGGKGVALGGPSG